MASRLDLVHLAVFCAFLYFGPRIQEYVQARGRREQLEPAQNDAAVENDDIAEQQAGDGREVEDEEVDAALPPAPADGQPGPANGPARRPQERNVSAKKAASLARRDHRRAVNEFRMAERDRQRANDAQEAAEREQELAPERERRKAAAAAIAEKQAEERAGRKRKEEAERQAEMQRRDLAVELVKKELEERKACDLLDVADQVGGDVDEVWVEKMLNAAGLLGKKGDALTMVTGGGWAVRIDESDMMKLYDAAKDTNLGAGSDGVGFEHLGKLLEGVISA
ncbi:uncharacterized protein LTR77_008117 [Saxophila tyrrhenica]|uniref:DDRGK domain-containing protein 1 n=1 Tax=Saxophila tyrrhenica TaxID=1690608 RepID=A0AAV9P5T8_9PEZI|nr:hypothetical protein LTR77_008117 [Saxophila tyrrhenica]